MHATITTLGKGQARIDFTVDVADIAKDLENAARRLSEERPIQGFRPGKATYDVVKNNFGEMAIYEAALGDIVRRTYVRHILEQKLEVFGEPSVNVTTLAPGNPIAFSATVTLVPKVLSLPDIGTHKVETRPAIVSPEEVEKTLKELTRMQVKEQKVDREVRIGDKIIVDMDLSRDGVPLEGGQARDHGIELHEDYYVPGLREKVLGMKKNESRSFVLKFPENHFQKHLAGQDVHFAVTIKEINEIIPPELNDAFAQTLGQKTLTGLRELIQGNMKIEVEEKERQRVELEVLEHAVERAKFEDIPESMLNAEIDRMIEELKSGVTQRGGEFNDYLSSIKKTVADLKLEFASQAVKRIKTALLIREYGQRENVDVEDSVVLEEQQRLLNAYSDDAKIQEQIRSEDYLEYIHSTLRNRKVVQILTDAALKK